MARFRPNVEEVWSRAEALRWMHGMGWEQDVIDSIMYRDNPDIETVRRLVYSVGPDEAYDQIEAMSSKVSRSETVIDVDQYTRLKREAEKAKEEHARAQGARENQLARLESEFKCGSVEEGEKLLAQLEKDEARISKKFDDEIEKFQKKFKEKI